LLTSQDAKRICELLESGPRSCRSVVEFFCDPAATMDGIIEARDAGKIALVDGKYEIVRD
jgi:hypothetical protein